MGKIINKLFKTNINTIKLPEYTSYYAPDYKFPMLVVENLKEAVKKPKIFFIRSETHDPFGKYDKIPADNQLSIEDYQLLKKYGLSPGHNAPAGHHKSSMENWGSTFYHINMTPQDITLNAGVWLILEQWCNYISNNPRIKNFLVLTGSIPAKENIDVEGLKVNVPPFMYKIVLATTKKFNTFYMACFLYPNKPIIPEGPSTELSKYLIDIEKLGDMTGLNMIDIVNHIVREHKLFNFSKKRKFKLNFNNSSSISNNNIKNNIKNNISENTKTRKNTNYMTRTNKNNKVKDIKYEFLGNMLRNGIQYNIGNNLKKSLINAKYFGLLINSKTMNELEKHWQDYQDKNEKENLNRSLEYHREYYDLAKQRILAKQPSLQAFETE